jgi:Uma2 family endonuclease
MSATITPPRLITAEEYAAMPDDGRRTELVRGRVLEMAGPGYTHAGVVGMIGILVGGYIYANRLGRYVGETSVRTQHDPDSVRIPDAAFYSRQRVPLEHPGPVGIQPVPPDLVFEVRSPSDRSPDVLAKVAEYWNAGVAVVVVVDPADASVIVYRETARPTIFTAADSLTLPDVLPGFAVPVAELFA